MSINGTDQSAFSDLSAARRPGRSTTGCSNCKRRKVKCDERKPTCSRCNDRHIKCPGYTTNTLRWSAKHEVHKASTSKSTPIPTPSSATSEHGIQEVALRDEGLYGFDRLIDPLVQHDPRYGKSNASWPLSPTHDTTASPSYSYSNNSQIAFPTLHITSSNIGQAADFATTESPAMTFETPSTSEEISANGVTRRLSDGGYADNNSVHSVDVPCQAGASVGVIGHTIRRRKSSAHDIVSIGNSTALLVSRNGTSLSSTSTTSLSPTILHVPTVLVEYYFRNVCRECSTYDSSYNPFRSTVAEMQFNSAPINYAIQSLAASKLADDMPLMKITGIEAQGKALDHLKRESMAANGLHNVSEEVLCTLLLLGMTTSWHVREDLGVEYLLLARRIIAAKSRVPGLIMRSNLTFYQNALKYWTMIVSIVSDRAEDSDEYDGDLCGDISPLPLSTAVQLEKIMPHPWTGISPAPQQLFGQVLQLIRKTRGESNRRQSSGFSRARIASMFNAITAAERLEAKCWSLRVPAVNEIEDTEDSSTPPIHHVLTAKGYLLAALLHIYMMFPDVLESRIQKEAFYSEDSNLVLEVDPQDVNMAHIVSATTTWPQRSTQDPHSFWLTDLGLRIVECLEGIEVKSGTRVVHPPLLLSVASVLVSVPHEETKLTPQSTNHLDNVHILDPGKTAGPRYGQSKENPDVHIQHCRTFIIHRLETMHALMRFHAIDNILKVVKEVWRRADTGSKDIFWMDVMHELRCESLFG